MTTGRYGTTTERLWRQLSWPTVWQWVPRWIEALTPFNTFCIPAQGFARPVAALPWSNTMPDSKAFRTRRHSNLVACKTLKLAWCCHTEQGYKGPAGGYSSHGHSSHGPHSHGHQSYGHQSHDQSYGQSHGQQHDEEEPYPAQHHHQHQRPGHRRAEPSSAIHIRVG